MTQSLICTLAEFRNKVTKSHVARSNHVYMLLYNSEAVISYTDHLCHEYAPPGCIRHSLNRGSSVVSNTRHLFSFKVTTHPLLGMLSIGQGLKERMESKNKLQETIHIGRYNGMRKYLAKTK